MSDRKTEIIKAHMAGQNCKPGRSSIKKAIAHYESLDNQVDYEKIPVSVLGLTGRARKFLKREKFENLHQIMEKSDQDLLDYRMLGKKTLKTIRDAVQAWCEKNK